MKDVSVGMFCSTFQKTTAAKNKRKFPDDSLLIERRFVYSKIYKSN